MSNAVVSSQTRSLKLGVDEKRIHRKTDRN